MSRAPHWVPGDALGLELPAHPAALREGGSEFLTRAFQAFCVLAPDNRVVRITECADCAGGSTGRKLRLSVQYARPQPDLHESLFVKFSRDFDDALRDRGRTQMAQECAFARLSRDSAFPIAVPACLYADYHAASGTGLLITQRIAFGRDGIEPQHGKCLDDGLPQPDAHYAAILAALAQLAGADKAGRLSAVPIGAHGLEGEGFAVGHRASYTAEQLRKRVERYGEFAARHPGLIPAPLRTSAFLADLMTQAMRVPALEATIRQELAQSREHIALSHWNANIDNAWFWTGTDGVLRCGLLDWGCAGRMNLAMAIWGALSDAEPEWWDRHFEAALACFVDEFHRAGGPRLCIETLKRQVLLYAGLMGLNWLLDVPAYLLGALPDLAEIQSRYDPRIRNDEAARTQLHMLIVFLNLWQTQGFGRALDTLVVKT